MVVKGLVEERESVRVGEREVQGGVKEKLEAWWVES